ncbi:MAG: kinase/pyrophosphorylase, partial [Gammaproteobacteria bacterium]|nr:kinase/pyrophosphorylase [Gammaproteobacteria bacterium]
MARRTVFFLSDQTGVTAEMLGHSLLTQFDEHEFDLVTLPFIDSLDKAEAAVQQINAVAVQQAARPIIFSTLVHDNLRDRFMQASGLFLDFFNTFLGPLEMELQSKSSHIVGRAHGIQDSAAYDRRIEATNFALNYDDGGKIQGYEQADVILVGVSRSGKTPTCLYLALTYGVFAANYPLAEDELESGDLPKSLQPFRDKLFGLTIAPERLVKIRKERRSAGRYASPQQVSFELRSAEALFKRWQIPFVDTTSLSIEEIASTILSKTNVERRVRP